MIHNFSLFFFKPKNKVKVTFWDDGKIVTKNVEILAINDKNISFKDAKYTYKCNSAAIKNIRKRLNFMILFTLVLLILILVGYLFLAFFDRLKRYYTDKNIDMAKKLLNDGRINYMIRADYSVGTEMDEIVKKTIEKKLNLHFLLYVFI